MTKNNLVQEIFDLDVKTTNQSRLQKIENILDVSLHEEIRDYFVTDLILLDGSNGIMSLILTDNFIVKIEMDEKEIRSQSFTLRSNTGSKYKIMDDGQNSFVFFFRNHNDIGLAYDDPKEDIDNFVKKFIEQTTKVKSLNSCN